jgi:hypothetical protein
MIKVTCLVDPQRTTRTPRKLGLEGPRTTVLVQCFLPWSKHMQSINIMQETCVIWMHRKKEEVILRILAEESLDLELWLKRYEFLKFWTYFCGFFWGYGPFYNYFSNFGPNWKIQGPWVNYKETQGLLCKNAKNYWISAFLIYFAMENTWTRSTLRGPRPRAGPRWIHTAARMGSHQRAAEVVLQLASARRWRSGREMAVWGTHHGAHQSAGSDGAAGRLGWSGGGGGARWGHVSVWGRRREGVTPRSEK